MGTGGQVWPVHFSVASVSRTFSSFGSFQFKSFVLVWVKAEAASSVQKWQQQVGPIRGWNAKAAFGIGASLLFRPQARCCIEKVRVDDGFSTVSIEQYAPGMPLGHVFHAAGSCPSRVNRRCHVAISSAVPHVCVTNK